MCGRYTLRAEPEAIAQQFEVEVSTEVLNAVQPRYNIAPSQPILAIRSNQQTAERELTFLRWGLVPFWAKDIKIGYRLINARSETVSEKPSFRAAYRYRRCLIPADGFYEWQRQNKRKKQPFHIRQPDQPIFAFAGLWEHWQDPAGAELETCTILTTQPNELMAPIHDRMPVIIAPRDYDCWLTAPSTRLVEPLLKPYPSELLTALPVSTLVNNAKVDHLDCLTRAER
ncbi:MAG: SOS response-associated peptidase [Cyanobacteria bacterium P01_H01_bin.121]